MHYLVILWELIVYYSHIFKKKTPIHCFGVIYGVW